MSSNILGKEPSQQYRSSLSVDELYESVEEIWEEYTRQQELDTPSDLYNEFHSELTPFDGVNPHEFDMQGSKYILEFRQKEEETEIRLYENTGYTSRNILEPEKDERDKFIKHLTTNWL